MSVIEIYRHSTPPALGSTMNTIPQPCAVAGAWIRAAQFGSRHRRCPMGPGPEVWRGVPEFADDLRGDFKDDAVAACAAERGRAVEVALLVEDEGGGGIGSVAAGEAVQHAVLPGPVGIGR